MIPAAWVVSLIAAVYAGYHHRKLVDAVDDIKSRLKPAVKSDEKESKSTFIDPDDVIQQARFEHEERMRKLNPDLYPDDQDS